MKRPVVITLLVTALALACVGIGSVVFFTLRRADFGFLNVPLVSATAEESKALTVDLEKPVTLKVDNDAGDVSVVGGDVQKVEVKIVKTGYAATEAGAQEHLETVQYDIKQNGNILTLTYKLDGPQTRQVDTVDFIVTVPTETTVTVDTGFGEVSVTDTKGDAKLENDFGDVTAQNIEGSLFVQTNSGTVEATSIKAGSKDIELRSDFGNITLEKANAANITFQSNSGKITLRDVNATGDFYSKSDFGDTKYENGSAASVTIESNSGKIELTKLKVKEQIKVDDDFGDITLTQASAASYDLHTNSGAITVDGAKGTIKASTDFGNIEVTNAEEAVLDLKTNSGSVEFSGSLGEEDHFVKSDFGNITLVLPADSKLNVDLKTDFGNIKSDLPITVTLTESSGNDSDEIAGVINDGGAQLTVQTNSGNININAMK